jgi:hypothetical protein
MTDARPHQHIWRNRQGKELSIKTFTKLHSVWKTMELFPYGTATISCQFGFEPQD